ncbi:hypothetical protein ACFTQ7_08480 [Lysinibacillus sp. NPDC056959]|uniref:hypothetical protein n=1 Tax=Lysinibacillus sp. NPDC056959 TaxID=3345981 RepID=UPI00362BC667
MKKLYTFSIMTLLSIFLLSTGASASENYIQWETEPNDSWDTGSFLMTYNYNQAINRGYISSKNDVDYWKFEYGNNPNGYQVALEVPGGYNYGVVVMEKINGKYVEVARDNGDFGKNAYVNIPGLKSDNSVPQYIIGIFSPYNIIYTPDEYYQLVVSPL